MCIDMCADMCVDSCVDMCVDICVDICVDMCVHMCVDICVDMGPGRKFSGMRSPSQRRNTIGRTTISQRTKISKTEDADIAYKHVCADMCADTRLHMRLGTCDVLLERSRRGGRFEYRHVYTRALSMLSSMPVCTGVHGPPRRR